MKKTVVLVSVLALLFGACSQIPGLTPTPGTEPTVNPDDKFKTDVAQTLPARPTLQSGSVSDTAPAPSTSPVHPRTDTATPVVASTTEPPSITDTATITPTQIIDLSATSVTATANIATATLV